MARSGHLLGDPVCAVAPGGDGGEEPGISDQGEGDSEVSDRQTKIRPSKSRLSKMLTKMFVTFAWNVQFGRFKLVKRLKFNFTVTRRRKEML